MTKKALEQVHAALTEIIDSWNDSAYDGDRGRSNDSLALVVFDDGSGFVAKRTNSLPDSIERLDEFDNAEQLADVLGRYGVAFQ